MSSLDDGQIPSTTAPKVKVSASAFAAKYRSKWECFNFLTVDCGVYLPAYGKYYQVLYVKLHPF